LKRIRVFRGGTVRTGSVRERLWDAFLSLGILLGVYGLACVAVGIGLAEISLHLPKRYMEDGAEFRDRVEQQFHAKVSDVSLSAEDGAQLRAWYVVPPKPNGEAVVLLHGIAGNRIDPSGFGDIFLQQGYSVLLPDSRGHGERDDVRRWVGWVRQRDPGCTYLLGESMGAAIGLQATEVTPDLCAVVVESPYARFREVTYERLGEATGTGTRFWQTLGRPAIEVAIMYTHLVYGIYLPDAAPQTAVEHSHVPTLLIAGTNDQQIPMHHAEELERSCESHCTLWIVPGADHGGASTVDPTVFRENVMGWFRQHDKPMLEMDHGF
jgi:pimeloyl-ACP methyl ester carboxylesterase